MCNLMGHPESALIEAGGGPRRRYLVDQRVKMSMKTYLQQHFGTAEVEEIHENLERMGTEELQVWFLSSTHALTHACADIS